MKKIVIFNNNVKANEFSIDDREARRLALSIANRGTHHIRDDYNTIIGYDQFGKEIMVVEIKKEEEAS